jgi:polyhydroxyalkanoate synthase
MLSHQARLSSQRPDGADQYAPSTARVHEIPLLFSPPWINKYYIMDLAGPQPGAMGVDHGHTVL